MDSVVSVNPFRCRIWPLHDRLEAYITEADCRSEIDSFSRHGQLVPALGRPLRADPDHDIEIVCGARRLFVARHLNKPLLVDVRDLSDREAMVWMDLENRQRQDVSPYERGKSYARWLRGGFFQSQDDIARALGISASQVSRLLKISRLPAVIVDAFNSPLEICEMWALDLVEAFDDPLKRQRTVRAAREIGSQSPRPQAREVYQKLLAATAHGRKVRTKGHDEVVRDDDGAPLFRVRHQSNAVAVMIPLQLVSAQAMRDIQRAIARILQGASGQPVDPKSPHGFGVSEPQVSIVATRAMGAQS